MVLAGPWSDPSTVTSSVLKDLTGKFLLDPTEEMKHVQIVLFSFYIAHCSTDLMQRSFLQVEGLIWQCREYSWSLHQRMCSTMNMRNISLSARSEVV